MGDKALVVVSLDQHLDRLAVEIREHHERAQAAFTTTVEEAIECGRRLNEAKSHVRHGEWLPWLEVNFPAGARTAQGYMRMADRAEDAQAVAHLGVSGVLKQLASPRVGPTGGVSTVVDNTVARSGALKEEVDQSPPSGNADVVACAAPPAAPTEIAVLARATASSMLHEAWRDFANSYRYDFDSMQDDGWIDGEQPEGLADAVESLVKAVTAINGYVSNLSFAWDEEVATAVTNVDLDLVPDDRRKEWIDDLRAVVENARRMLALLEREGRAAA